MKIDVLVKEKNSKSPSNDSLSSVKAQVLQGDALRQQAMAHARAARENIGEDTIARIVAAMEKKKSSPIERAKAEIQNADAERVASEILAMLEKH